jgi:hypothetical protein
MNIALASNLSCVAPGRGKEAGSGRWSDRAISGCTSTVLWSHRAERLPGCSCRPSTHLPFLLLLLPSSRSKGLGQTSTSFSFSIKQAGTKAVILWFPKDCICSFCHRIRRSCNQPNVCGRSPMSRSPIGSSARSTSLNRSNQSAAVGSKLMLRSFAGEHPFTGGLL